MSKKRNKNRVTFIYQNRIDYPTRGKTSILRGYGSNPLELLHITAVT